MDVACSSRLCRYFSSRPSTEKCHSLFCIILDEEAKTETLAIRFANADNAKKFKESFDNAVVSVIEWEADRISNAEKKIKSPTKEKTEDTTEEVASEKLTSLSIKD